MVSFHLVVCGCFCRNNKWSANDSQLSERINDLLTQCRSSNLEAAVIFGPKPFKLCKTCVGCLSAMINDATNNGLPKSIEAERDYLRWIVNCIEIIIGIRRSPISWWRMQMDGSREKPDQFNDSVRFHSIASEWACSRLYCMISANKIENVMPMNERSLFSWCYNHFVVSGGLERVATNEWLASKKHAFDCSFNFYKICNKSTNIRGA